MVELVLKFKFFHLPGVDEYLGNLHKEHENILSHMNFTKNVFDPGVSCYPGSEQYKIKHGFN
jgi:hypothetical protein